MDSYAYSLRTWERILFIGRGTGSLALAAFGITGVAAGDHGLSTGAWRARPGPDRRMIRTSGRAGRGAGSRDDLDALVSMVIYTR